MTNRRRQGLSSIVKAMLSGLYPLMGEQRSVRTRTYVLQYMGTKRGYLILNINVNKHYLLPDSL